jgi:GGDEF domain-containing protein
VDSNDPGLLAPETQESFLAYARLATFFLALRVLRGRISRVPDVDSVTGLNSFKVFHEILHRELSRAEKFHHPVSLLFLKIRSFRKMNDVYGHVGEVDCAARSGGMIYIVLPQMAKAEAVEVARRIVDAMNDLPVGKGDILLTVAIGVTQYPKDGDTERVLIPHTEAMIHESLRKGGNAFTVYRD